MAMQRRQFIRTAGIIATGMIAPRFIRRVGAAPAAFDVEEVTIADLQAAFGAGGLTAASLVAIYTQRIQAIDRNGPTLRSVQELNPDALAIAGALDDERRAKG